MRYYCKVLILLSFVVLFSLSITVSAEKNKNIKTNINLTHNKTPIRIDTLSGYLNLAVFPSGNYGGGAGLSLDYIINGVDCDTTASVYLYDGSPFISKIVGTDTVLYHSLKMYQNADVSFISTDFSYGGSEYDYSWYSTNTFITLDSTIALEQSFYAPTANGANYMIKTLKVWSHDGASHSGIRIGDIIDWDIPSDSGNDNLSGIDALITRNLIYQVGTEFDTDDTIGNTDCMDGDRRFGGMAFLKSVRNGTNETDTPYSAYTARNDSFIYPTGNLVAGELWKNTESSGFSVEADYTDQYMVMCYDPYLSLGANDTVIYFTSLITVYDGTAYDVATAADNAEAFVKEFRLGKPPCPACGFGMSGNMDGDPNDIIDISDLVFLVEFMFNNGPASWCLGEANIDSDPNAIIDISDLVFLVDFMFNSGPTPGHYCDAF